MTQYQLDQEIQSITNQLVRTYKPVKIILFGSGARGDFGENSDLDILVIKDGVDKVRRHDRNYKVRKLLQSALPLDILVYSPYEINKRLYLGDPFVESVIHEGKVLYGA